MLEFTDYEIDFLKSKKIVRDNLILYNLELVDKIDKFSIINKTLFSESIFIICNGFEIPLCANCLEFRPKFISNKRGYKKYCSTKCSNSHLDTKNNKKDSYFEKYGVENPSFLESVKEKISKSMRSQTQETKLKRKETMILKYGFGSNILRPDIIRKRNNKLSNYSVVEKRKKTCLEKYGFDSFTKTEEYRNKVSNKYQERMISTTLNKDLNFVNHLGKGLYELKCDLGEHNFTINRHLYHARKRIKSQFCTICNPVGDTSSVKEMEVLEFIKSNYKGEVIHLFRQGLEIDIYLPDLNLGFEFNGLYWHSEIFKGKNYHLDKTEHFEQLGIRIIHIWEDDWIYRNTIIKSQIKNWLGFSDLKIGARICQVKEIIDKAEYRKFLDENHIQGYVPSTLKLGLYYKNELVSLMTFDHFEGRKKMNLDEWNLSRFCNKINTNVLGGASKLLKYFISNYKPSRVISFSDKSWSIGNLYFKLGFLVKNITKPNYYYVVDGVRSNKQKWKKSNLVKLGFDKKLSESQIMENNFGSFKIFDCGQMKFEMNCDF